MNELYWIGRLDVINGLSWVVFALSLISLLIFVIAYCYNKSDEYEEEAVCTAKRFIKISIIFLIISTPFAIFIPSKQEMYLMWGVGSVIDYVKENDTAKQLPDKAIQALDKWFDSLTENEKEK